MDDVFAQSKRMFEQPLSEKMKLLRNEKHRGYTPILDELLDPEKQLKGLFFLAKFQYLFFIFFSNWVYPYFIYNLFVLLNQGIIRKDIILEWK